MNRLWKKDSPIFSSMMETDTYKILMMYFIWRFFPNLRVKFEFTNRTKSVRLAEIIDLGLLRENIAHVRSLGGFNEAQIEYFRSWQMFPETFLSALRTISLPEVLVETAANGQLRIVVEGLWLHVTLWELFILPMITELRARRVIGEDDSAHAAVIKDGEARLLAKIPVLKSLRWMIALFDLRRRLTGDWERHTTQILYEQIPERLSGISNVQLAHDTGVASVGTNAHELPMALIALRAHEGEEAMRAALYEVLEKWQLLYGHKALIMLTDTVGSGYFFRNIPKHFLRDYRGIRQDSGDPFMQGESYIGLYHAEGIDPLQKLALFTDGLDPGKMVSLELRFFGRIGGGFGWGTNKGHDVGILDPISIVMKLVEAAGNPAAKLSDNGDKAVGFDSTVCDWKRIFQYHETYRERPVY